jgi:DNA gyrase subunit A
MDSTRVIDVDVEQEMRNSFLEYAYSVIYARALPDARDGLKPVQRRILFQMAQMGLLPTRPHVKSARVVGDVMGRWHPHGDSAIYDAMVRLAQPFTLRLPLVDGHGNFGSLDDGPAAYRYTEARLASPALLMTDSLDEDVVDFVPNYDSQLMQPEVLPSALPNLLVNGASGIAVGMATNMAPHNLGEVVAAARHMIEHPQATVEDLMQFLPGPDLPGGGKIIGLDGVREAYATGRGIFRTRATTRIENVTARRKGIVVTELPYLVGPEKVIDKIKDAVHSGRLQGIAGVTDLTDRRHGLRIIIEIKNAFNPEAVLEKLFQLTPMEDSFAINNVALVDGQPRTLGLRELLQVYLDHRLTVIKRRCQFRLERRRERLHLVDGLLVAILDIDKVIRVIRAADDAATARTDLMHTFNLTEVQAEHILELRLRRLTRLSRLELESEQQALRSQIAELSQLLASDQAQRQLLSQELADVAAEHGTPRRTVLLESAGLPARSTTPLEVADTACWAVLAASARLARCDRNTEPGETGHLPRHGERSAHDAIQACVPTTVRAEIAAITSQGRALRLNVLDLPALPTTQQPVGLAGGIAVSELVDLAKDEQVVGLMSLAPTAAPIALGTAQGLVKRVIPEAPARDAWEVITLKPGDKVIHAAHAPDQAELVFITDDAQLLHFAAAAVRPQGRPAAGMAGIRLATNKQVLAFAVLPPGIDAEVVTIAGSSTALAGTESGCAKVTDFAAYPAKGRATGGVRCQRFLRGQDCLILAWAGPTPGRAQGANGQPIVLPQPDPRRDGSGTPLKAVVAAVG